MAENLQLNKPERFIPRKNRVAEDWRSWKDAFLIYLELTGVETQLSGKQKAFLLLNLMGEEAIKAKNKMSFDNPCEMENMEILLMKFDDIFDPPTNEIEERYKFFSRYKDDKESIDDYVADLQEQAEKCNFGNQVDKFIVDMIILNMNYYLQQGVFTLEDPSLLNTVLFYKKEAITEEKIKNMYLDDSKNSDYEKNAKKTSNNAINNSFSKKPTYVDDSNNLFKKCTDKFNDPIEKNKKSINNSTKTQNQQSSMFNSNDQSKSTCSTCGALHPNQKCPKHSQDEAMNFPPKNCPSNPFLDKGQICQWCESRHGRGECLHDANCTICDKFPHNICFQCRKNPHDNNCYYKSILTLPQVVPSLNNRFKSDIPTCLQCGTKHITATCPTPNNDKCKKCNNFGHLTEECPLYNYKNFADRQNLNTRTNTADPSPHTNSETKTKRVCSKCGTNHPYMQCPAYNKKCSKCGLLGHYNWICKNQVESIKFDQCPLCKSETLQYDNKNDLYYCWTCHRYMDVQDSDSDEAVADYVVRTERKQRPRRRQRRQNYSKKEEESACCIS